MDNREKIKEKLKKKRDSRKGINTKEHHSFDESNTDIMGMLDKVNKMLKTNPQMVQQISKCVSNVMNNKDLMSSLTNQFGNELNVKEAQVDQTLDKSSLDESSEASSNESKQ